MSTMITELYDALKDAGASDASARKAAETMAAYESRFAKVDADLTLLKGMVGLALRCLAWAVDLYPSGLDDAQWLIGRRY